MCGDKTVGELSGILASTAIEFTAIELQSERVVFFWRSLIVDTRQTPMFCSALRTNATFNAIKRENKTIMQLFGFKIKRLGALGSPTVARRRYTRGATLVEFLIAGTIGVFLLAGVLQVLNAVRDTNGVMRSISDIQDSGWSAMRLLDKDISMAGFGGCASGETLETSFTMVARSLPRDTNLFVEALMGFTAKQNDRWQTKPGQTAPMYEGIQNPVSDSDIVRVMRGGSHGVSVQNNMSRLGDGLKVENNGRLTFEKDDIVMVSDCASADVFSITNEPDNQANPTNIKFDGKENRRQNRLTKLYGTESFVRPFSINYYYVGFTGREDSSGREVRALFKLPQDGEPIELIQGVDTMQVLYGERLTNGSIRYSDVSKDDIDWRNVISLRIALLVSSNGLLPGMAEDNNTYSVAGEPVGPGQGGSGLTHGGDSRLRRVFSTTVHLHNKSPAINGMMQ